MRERGILFSAPMVRAILDGTKTQTRRTVKSPAKNMQANGMEVIKHREPGDPWYRDHVWSMRGKTGVWGDYTHEKFLALCPYGAPGDRLWVRETWALDPGSHPDDREVLYRATDPGWDDNGTGLKWRPSILMPRWASRITLEITDVRVERVQDISDADIRAEGVTAEAVRDLAGPTVKIGFTSTNGARDPRGLIEVPVGALDPRQLWQLGWTAINGAESWDANPWLWCLTFRRMP